MPQACNVINRMTLAQVISCEFYKIFKNTFFHRTSLMAASLYFISTFLVTHVSNNKKPSIIKIVYTTFSRFVTRFSYQTQQVKEGLHTHVVYKRPHLVIQCIQYSIWIFPRGNPPGGFFSKKIV